VRGGYHGWLEEGAAFGRRLEVPGPLLPLILNLGGPFLVSRAGAARETPVGSFVAGLDDAWSLVGSDGPSCCIQLDLTPPGARRLLGVPGCELAGRVVELDDLPAWRAAGLPERLRELCTWEERFAALDAFLLGRLAAGPPADPGLEHVWRRLEASDGRLPVGTVAAELGWSRKRLLTACRREAGAAPKLLARLVRFERLVGRLRAEPSPSLADAAYGCGYYDQAHLNRDFRELAGTTPTRFLAARLPDGGGVTERAAPGTSVQDGGTPGT